MVMQARVGEKSLTEDRVSGLFVDASWGGGVIDHVTIRRSLGRSKEIGGTRGGRKGRPTSSTTVAHFNNAPGMWVI